MMGCGDHHNDIYDIIEVNNSKIILAMSSVLYGKGAATTGGKPYSKSPCGRDCIS